MSLTPKQQNKIDEIISYTYKCEVDDFEAHTLLSELGDSLTKVAMEMELESQLDFQGTIPDSESEKLKTVQDVYSLMDSYINL